jgi:hypothetical protein
MPTPLGRIRAVRLFARTLIGKLVFPLLLGSSVGFAACSAVVSAPPTPHPADFAISVTPSSVSTQVGGTPAPVAVSLTPRNGFAGQVTVTLSGLPLGVVSSPASPFTMSIGTTQSVAFSAPAAAGTFTAEFQGVSGELSHNASAILTIAPPQSPFLVSASYYPWYNPTAWAYAECSTGTLRGDLLPSQLPVLGKYNSYDEETVTQQIAWSTAAGINVWDLEWVAPNDQIDGTIQNSVLANPHIRDLHFAIFYDYANRFNHDFNLTPDKIATIASDFQYLAAHYFRHPSYLTAGSRRPVVFFYLSRALNPVSDVQQMVSAVRKAVSVAGFNIYLIGDEYYAAAPPDPVRIANWDAIFGYDVYVGASGYSDTDGYLAMHSAMYSQYAAAAKQLGVDFVPSVMPGFNDRAIRQTCANHPALARRTSAEAVEGSMFNSFLQQLAIPYAANSQLRMIHITSFNEWLEDTEIEPAVVTDPTTLDISPTGSEFTQGLKYQGFGTTYLDILRSQLSPAKQTGVP